MDAPPSSTEPPVTGIRAERVVRQFQLRRPAIVFLSALLSVVFLCIALSFIFSAAHSYTLVADNGSKIQRTDARLVIFRASFDTNMQLLAANDAKKGSSVGWFFRRYIFGVPTVIIGAVKDGTSPIDEYTKYNNWINETSVTDARLKTEQSQLQRDIADSEQKQSSLAAQRPSLMAAFDSQRRVRNWFGIFAVAAGLVAFIASRARTTQTIHSVITAFTSSAQTFSRDSFPVLPAVEVRHLPPFDGSQTDHPNQI